jgi:O-antigen/teichoic acid export membrane protein
VQRWALTIGGPSTFSLFAHRPFRHRRSLHDSKAPSESKAEVSARVTSLALVLAPVTCQSGSCSRKASRFVVADGEVTREGELLERRAAKSSAWVVAGFASSVGLRLLSSVVLTRFIHPEVYGVMDLVVTLLVALHLFSDIGIVPCIVQSPRGGESRHLNTVWTMQLLRSALILLVATAVAAPIARVYGRPILTWLVPAVGVTGLIECLCSTGMFTLNRQVRRARLVTIEFLSSFITFVVTVAAVYAWNRDGFRSVLSGRISHLPFDESLTWTIVIGSIVGKIAMVALSYALTPGGIPRFDWQKDTVREVFGFGRWVFFSTMMHFLAQQADRLIVPKVSNFETNGLYGRSLALLSIGTGLVENLASAIVFPTISRAVEHGTNPSEYAHRVGLISKLVSATILTGLFAAGPSIVHVLYPETYSAVAWILQILIAVGWFQCQSFVAGSILLGVGKPAGVMLANGSKLAALVLLVLPAVTFAHAFKLSSIVALIAVVCIGEVVRYISYVTIVTRMKLWNPWTDLGAMLVTPAIALAITAGGKCLTFTLLAANPSSKWDWMISMLTHGSLVLVVFGAITAVFWRLGYLRLSI